MRTSFQISWVDLAFWIAPFLTIYLLLEPVWWHTLLAGLGIVFYANAWAAVSVQRFKDKLMALLAYDQVSMMQGFAGALDSPLEPPADDYNRGYM
jgi:hypothetical protein